MTVSNVSIVNGALTKIGADRILSLTDDVKEAREANSLFERIRDAELRSHNWSFSIKRAQLAAQSEAPLFGYAYAYRQPSDCLKILDVGDYYPGGGTTDYVTGNDAEYSLEAGLILTDFTAPLNLRYISRVTDPTRFDAMFVEAFACKLAYELAETITASSTKKGEMMQAYMMALSMATKANAIERAPIRAADDSFVLSRL